VSIEEICLREKRFKKVFEGLGKLIKIHKEERDPSKIPEIIGEITGTLILIQTDFYWCLDHLKRESREVNETGEG